MALEGYKDEYLEEDWPLNMMNWSDEESGGFVTSNLFTMLIGEKVDGLNKRHIEFFSMGRDLRISGDPIFGVAGVLDPWGRVYRISVDVNDDGKIVLREADELVEIVGQRVVVWSYGPDRSGGDEQTVKDNIRTWR
jgi:hypothetical protein